MLCKPQYVTFVVSFSSKDCGCTWEDKVILILTLITWQEQLMLCVFWQHALPLISVPARFPNPNKICTQDTRTKHNLLSLMCCDYCSWYIALVLDRRSFCFVSTQTEIKPSGKHRRFNYSNSFKLKPCNFFNEVQGFL